MLERQFRPNLPSIQVWWRCFLCARLPLDLYSLFPLRPLFSSFVDSTVCKGECRWRELDRVRASEREREERGPALERNASAGTLVLRAIESERERERRESHRGVTKWVNISVKFELNASERRRGGRQSRAESTDNGEIADDKYMMGFNFSHKSHINIHFQWSVSFAVKFIQTIAPKWTFKIKNSLLTPLSHIHVNIYLFKNPLENFNFIWLNFFLWYFFSRATFQNGNYCTTWFHLQCIFTHCVSFWPRYTILSLIFFFLWWTRHIFFYKLHMIKQMTNICLKSLKGAIVLWSIWTLQVPP